MVDEDFLKRYRESVDLVEDNYSLIDESCIRPIKKDYTYWDDYWEDLVKYLITFSPRAFLSLSFFLRLPYSYLSLRNP